MQVTKGALISEQTGVRTRRDSLQRCPDHLAGFKG